jgi:hypothetical protein
MRGRQEEDEPLEPDGLPSTLHRPVTLLSEEYSLSEAGVRWESSARR